MAISIFNRKKQFFAPEVEALIKQLTGFEEDDRNYQEVERYIYSNIIHHHFATVDITKVKQSVDGYVEKFRAHGLNNRAQRLRNLVDKYIASDTSQHTQLNVQWHVLWLLINLSEKPTAVLDEDFKVEELPKLAKPEEEINWAEYLREGLEEFQCPSENSEDEELWLSTSEGDEDEPLPTEGVRPRLDEAREELKGLGSIPHPSLWHLAPPPSKKECLRRIIQEEAKAEQWLRSNVQHSWWSDPSCCSIVSSKRPEARVCVKWESCQKRKEKSDSSELSSQFQIISEFKAIQEVLWLLQVPTHSGLFCRDENDQFHVKSNVSLPSTIPETFRLYLERLCPYINMVNSMKKFNELLNDQEMSDDPPPVTYRAYSAALFRQLHKFTNIVINIETRLNRQDETMTLLSVMEELSPGLNILQYLYDIHKKAITDDWMSQPAWFCATRLLSVLYEAVCEASDERFLGVSLDIFIHSFHPYLDIIDVWLSEGRLENWRKEFLVIREDDESLNVMPYESEMVKCGVTPVPLLTRLVTVVKEAGRTMEIVNSLNKLSDFRDSIHNKGCLFKEFSENVYSEIKRLKENIHDMPEKKTVKQLDNLTTESSSDVKNSKEMSFDMRNEVEFESEKQSQISLRKADTSSSPISREAGNDRGEVPFYLLSVSGKAMYDQTMSVLLHNPLLGKVFCGYFSPDATLNQHSMRPASPIVLTDYGINEKVSRQSGPTVSEAVSLVGLMSIHSVLERQLCLVEMRHHLASRLITDTLRREHSLQQHFIILRTVYFMENGNLAQSFYSYLFKEIEAGTWNNLISLNYQLKMSIEEYFPSFKDHFAVQISQRKSKSHVVHDVIPLISLVFKADWPISLVITEDSIESYNKVFRFLLHLKYAFWTLNNIRFCDLADSCHPLWVRRLHVLKTWMLHSTNTLHSYFMGLVLRSYSTHLEQSVQSADSMQLIVQAHSRFLDEVKVHCLQDKKNYLECFIKKLLKLCSSLSDLWEMEATGSLTEAELSVVEEDYLIAYRGLIHCLDKVSPEEDQGNFLYELKCEIASSEPENFTVENQ